MPPAPFQAFRKPSAIAVACLILLGTAQGVARAEDASATQEPTVEGAADNPLEPLAWIVGDWANAGSDGATGRRVRVSCRWTKNERFITRQFSVHDADEFPLLEGTQVIGRDPVSRQVRSWTFDSEGGFGDATWTPDGNRWLIKASFTLATGERASALHVLTQLDADTATWASINREVDGQLQPSQPAIEVTRVTTTPEAPAPQEGSE